MRLTTNTAPDYAPSRVLLIQRALVVGFSLVFTFSGTEGALNTGGEVKTPTTTIPRAIFLAMIIVTSLYMGVQLAAQGILGAELAGDERAPLATAAGKALGPAGRQLILTGVLIST